MAGGAPAYTYQWYIITGAIIPNTNQTATGLSAGDYYVVVTDANTCESYSDTVTINEPLAITATIAIDSVSCFGLCDGQAVTTVGGGTQPYSFQWDNALMEVTPNAQGLCAQNYSVIITDANGCAITETINVDEPNPILLDSTVVNANCQQADGEGCVLASGGTGAYSYLWPSGGTNSCETNLIASTYLVDVTDANGCTETIAVEVSDLSGPTAAIIAQVDVSCNGGNDGSATVDMTGGAGTSFTVLWDANANGQTTPTASNLVAGVYSVTITDDLGCNASTNVTITEPTAILYVGNTVDASCFSYCDGSAWINMTGGTPGYTYTWMDNGGNVVGTVDSIGGLCSGTYSVSVSDANGCNIIDSYIIADPAQVTANATFTDVTCNGACDGTATAAGQVGIAPFSYAWDDPNTQSTATATNLCPGTYTCTVTDANGCFTTVTVTIVEPAVLTASIVGSTNVTCFGFSDGSATANAAGGNGNYSYAWDNGAGNNQVATNLGPNNYTVTVTDDLGCQATASVVITEPTALAASTSSTNNSCYQSCDGSATVNPSGGSGGYSYQWNDPNFQTTATAIGLCAGTFDVVVTDANGCQITETVVITEPNELSLTAVPQDANCGQANGQICISAVGGTGPFTYQWNDPNTTTSACVTGVVAGCYTVIITDANGCSHDSTICINDIAGPTVTAVNFADVTCNGAADGMVEFSSTGGTPTVTFELFQSPSTTAISTTLLTTGLDGGTYSLVATDGAGCIGTAQITVAEPNALNSAITNSIDVSCNLGSDGEATVSISGGSVPYDILWNNGQTTPTATGLQAGTYTVTITDANNCQSTSSVTITEPAPIVINPTITDVTCNNGFTGVIDLAVTGGTGAYTYLWSPMVSTGPTANGVQAGNYTIDVTDANGCTESITVTVTEPSALVSSVGTVNSTCSDPNGAATVTMNGGVGNYVYDWNGVGNNPVGSTNSGLSAGTYNVIVTDGNGCTLPVSVTITDEPGPDIVSVTNTQPSCNGLSNGTATVNATSPNNYPLTYLWDDANAQTSQTATGLAAGTYVVIVTDPNGCTASMPTTISEPNPLLPVPDLDATICFGDSSQLWASGQGGTAPYTPNWSTPGITGAGPIMVSPTTTTDYCFTVTDANGCISPQGCVTITVLPPLDLTVDPSISICDGDDIDLSATASAGNGGPYTFDWTDENGTPVTDVEAGNTSTINVGPNTQSWYYVVASDGCSIDAMDSVQVSINPTPSLFLNSVDSSGCEDFTTTFIGNSDIATNWVYDFGCDGTIDYDGNSGTVIHTFPDPGVYDVCVTVTSAAGCDTSMTASQMIEVFPLPEAGFIPNPTTTSDFDPTIVFNDNSIGGQTYTWDFGDGNGVSGNIGGVIPAGTNGGITAGTYDTPIHTYQAPGEYTVTLTVINSDGCEDVYTFAVTVDPEFAIFVPNAITLDDNGLNEIFLPQGIGIANEEYSLYIYDRWGQLVYESHDLYVGWDGRDPRNSNVTIKSDVYVWKIQCKDYKGSKHERVGHVTVIR
jgi:gliding motility-associated-like protein